MAYDDLFIVAAQERGLIQHDFRGTKVTLRDAVRGRLGGESDWQALQAHVYGKLILRAPTFPGFREFAIRAKEVGAQLAIVSHKTAFATTRPAEVNLRAAARNWLFRNDLIGNGLIAEHDVYFESSRSEKIARFYALDAQVVVDDLIEVLTDPAFPAQTRRWLFSPGDFPRVRGDLECFSNWRAMREALERLIGHSR